MKLRSHLIVLVTTALVPLLAFSGVMIVVGNNQQRAATEQNLLDISRALSLAVDHELGGSIRTLEALGTSAHLETGNLREFYKQAAKILKTRQDWNTIALFDRDGHLVLNLLLPFGAPLPTAPTSDPGIRSTVAQKKPMVSNLFFGRVAGGARLAVNVPVLSDGQVRYIIAATFNPAAFMKLIATQNISPSWLATIIDRNQIIVARNRDGEKLIGKPASSSFAAQAKQHREAIWRGITLEGIATVSALNRSEFSGWTVGLAISADEFDTPLKNSLLRTLAGGLLLMLAGILMALASGRRIAASYRALSRAASDVARGEIPSLGPLAVAEANVVASALSDAARQRSEATRAITESEQRLRAILDSAKDGIVIMDRGGNIVDCNPATEVLFGHERGQLAGRPLADWIVAPAAEKRAGPEQPGFELELFQDDDAVAAAAPQDGNGGLDHYFGPGADSWLGRRTEMTALTASGKTLPVELTITRILGAATPLFAAHVRDLTENKEREQFRRRSEELEVHALSMREASRLKSEFLANMSHELRTPLNAIIGFSQMMHDGKVGPVSVEQKEYLGDVLSSSRHLLQLINDILDVSKIEAGKMAFDPEAVELAGVVSELNAALRSLAMEKNLDVQTDLDPALGAVVADRRSLKQVLYNYLSNAIKFTDNGGRIIVRSRAEGPVFFRLEVEDNGKGIRADDLGGLFRDFEQLDNSLAKRHGGTGLGLALTKKLVEAQGGRIGVTSTVAKGSIFFAVLPRVVGTARSA